ncbi:MAG: DUF3560 domain-containing protein [Proteobacteria bacterium]|nr:DUF3560 domain-containing protein [Pseudomonadota bacterium]
MPRNDFEEKREDRLSTLKERAQKASTQADGLYDTADKMASVIPFGQPILVGHHSEKRDRNYRNRISNTYQKSMEASDKAAYYSNKAKSAESNEAISSDDPEALQKLRAKIEKAEIFQGIMKKVNGIIRKKPKNEKTDKKIKELAAIEGIKETTAEKLFTPDFCGRIGFASYELQNNNANIRRMKQRLAELEKSFQDADKESIETEYEGFTVIENYETNRIQIDFHSKEDYLELCKSKGINLRSYGFKFSKYDGNVWQRLLNNAGKYAVENVVKLMT